LELGLAAKDEVPGIFAFNVGWSLVLAAAVVLPHGALPWLAPAPRFPPTVDDGPLSVVPEARDDNPELAPLVGACAISKSISVSSA
jgi:hypothetical protein